MFFSRNRACEIRRSETGCSQCGLPGIIEGTTVRTASGWRPIETIDISDQWSVLSGDPRPSLRFSRHDIWHNTVSCPTSVRPLLVPEGALGNDESVLVQQDSRLVFESSPFTDLVDASHVSIKAGDLIGIHGIEITDTPPSAVRVFQPQFEASDAIQIAGGLWQLCEAPCAGLDIIADDAWEVSRIGRNTVRHLTTDEAVMFFGALDSAMINHRNRPIRDMFF